MDETIIPGSVYYFFCDNTKPPKYKYLVLLSIEPVLWFFINSEMTKFIQSEQSLRDRQVELIRIPHHTFLDHDSYIDCLSVQSYDDITLEDLHEWSRDPNILKGQLHQTVIEEIIEKVKDPITISPFHANIIIKSLS